MTTQRILRKKHTVHLTFLITVALTLLVSAHQSHGQIRAGSAYLKMLPGAREVGFGSGVSGVLDFAHSYQANPGAAGFMREWTWAATYTNWISDVYNTSFFYGRQFRTPWSRNTGAALSLNYLGIPEFNSGGETVVSAAGSNLVASASLGQRLDFISPNISLGTGVKFFNSEMGEFNASTWILDFGMMARSRRFHIQSASRGIWDYAILSAGVSVTNLGEGLSFVSERSPLPRTLRSGAALQLGSHRHFQMTLAAEYRDTKDEQGFFLLGSEFSFRNLIALRAGYSFEDNLLGQFSFGGSFQFDDLHFGKLNPGRNNALRFDLAVNQQSAFVSAPYHGTVTHQPIGPEKFEFITPVNNDWVDIDSVRFCWAPSADPDLYDDISYRLLVDRDSVKLHTILNLAGIAPGRALAQVQQDSFFISEPLLDPSYAARFNQGGHYYWMVLALDRDNHIRFAEKDNRRIARFFVSSPRPEITDIEFDYYPWITEDDMQGKLKFHVKNNGSRTANKYSLSVYDSLANGSTDASADSVRGHVLIANVVLDNLEPQQSTVVELDWRSSLPGRHRITGQIRRISTDEMQHAFSEMFHSIPKGIFAAEEHVAPMKIHKTEFELPVIGKIYFKKGSAEIGEEYIRRWKITPPLALFAERLASHPEMKIYVQGAADKNSDETIDVAGARARAVADSLIKLGVNKNQIEILPDTLIHTAYLPPTDTPWRVEERWRADIFTDVANEKIVFGPLKTVYNRFAWNAVPFRSTISSPIPISTARLFLSKTNMADTVGIAAAGQADLPDTSNWHIAERFPERPSLWLYEDVHYHIALTDSLQRAFQTRDRDVALGHAYSKKERMYYIIAQFNEARAFYEFYWEGLVDSMYTLLKENENMRMKFHGHGCAIGSETANHIVSARRTQTFHQKFLDDLLNRKFDKNNPADLALFEKLKARIDVPPEGHGESQPLIFLAPDGQEILLGDNETPLGRQLNRRIMVHLYTN
ncbi:MAG: PorV/PorQ family protein [Candidatus Zhuqueibacterota bacterium]